MPDVLSCHAWAVCVNDTGQRIKDTLFVISSALVFFSPLVVRKRIPPIQFSTRVDSGIMMSREVLV